MKKRLLSKVKSTTLVASQHSDFNCTTKRKNLIEMVVLYSYRCTKQKKTPKTNSYVRFKTRVLGGVCFGLIGGVFLGDLCPNEILPELPATDAPNGAVDDDGIFILFMTTFCFGGEQPK